MARIASGATGRLVKLAYLAAALAVLGAIDTAVQRTEARSLRHDAIRVGGGRLALTEQVALRERYHAIRYHGASSEDDFAGTAQHHAAAILEPRDAAASSLVASAVRGLVASARSRLGVWTRAAAAAAAAWTRPSRRDERDRRDEQLASSLPVALESSSRAQQTEHRDADQQQQQHHHQATEKATPTTRHAATAVALPVAKPRRSGRLCVGGVCGLHLFFASLWVSFAACVAVVVVLDHQLADTKSQQHQHQHQHAAPSAPGGTERTAKEVDGVAVKRTAVSSSKAASAVRARITNACSRDVIVTSTHHDAERHDRRWEPHAGAKDTFFSAV